MIAFYLALSLICLSTASSTEDHHPRILQLPPTTRRPTFKPTTKRPVIPVISTVSPTYKPTTSPTTRTPTSSKPTTSKPTSKPTASPTTRTPTSSKPTTSKPTSKPTASPTTRKPTSAPTVSITALRREISDLIRASPRRDLIPKFLRLGFHDCVGGCNGCVDMNNPDNKGLQEPIDAIAPLVAKYNTSYSRADIWALATLVSADVSIANSTTDTYPFTMTHIGRFDCDNADDSGVGGPDVALPSSDLTTHELLTFFKNEFNFDTDETVAIMGAHAVAEANRTNTGFGNIDREDGWVYNPVSWRLNNRYYDMLVGETTTWEMEHVTNTNGIPSRHQWFQQLPRNPQRPIMTNSDMALARNLTGYMSENGNVSCDYVAASSSVSTVFKRKLRSLQTTTVACPIASETIAKMLEYKMDNDAFLFDFEMALSKMLLNGYDGGNTLTKVA